jgi:hypothetical protein
MLFYRLYLNGTSLHGCASKCDVCLKTAQFMKRRIEGMLGYDSLIPASFCGEMAIDARILPRFPSIIAIRGQQSAVIVPFAHDLALNRGFPEPLER